MWHDAMTASFPRVVLVGPWKAHTGRFTGRDTVPLDRTYVDSRASSCQNTGSYPPTHNTHTHAPVPQTAYRNCGLVHRHGSTERVQKCKIVYQVAVARLGHTLNVEAGVL